MNEIVIALIKFLLELFGAYLIFPILVVVDSYQYMKNCGNKKLDLRQLFYYLIFCLGGAICNTFKRSISTKGIYDIYFNSYYEYYVKNGIKPHFEFGEYNEFIINVSNLVFTGINVFLVIAFWAKVKYKENIKIFDIVNIEMLIIGLFCVFKIIFFRNLTGISIDLLLSYILFVIFLGVLILKSKYLFNEKKFMYTSIGLLIYMFLSVFALDLSDISYFLSTNVFLCLLSVPSILLMFISENTDSDKKMKLLKLCFYFCSFSNGGLLICII